LQEKHQIGGPANLDARQRRELRTNRIGRNVTPQIQPNQKWQLTGGNRAASDRVLRNSFFGLCLLPQRHFTISSHA
jgi:hypothetical protein